MEDPRPQPSGPSPATRVFSFLAGIISLGIGTLITIGFGLAGAISIGITALVLKRKKRRLTRRGAWFASVGATIAVLAIFSGFAILRGNSQPTTPAERAEQRARATQAMPDWLKTVNPNAQRQTAAADSIATALLENKALMLWAGLMTAVIGAVLMGTIAGSFVWGGVMLLNRGFTGDWLPSTSADSTHP